MWEAIEQSIPAEEVAGTCTDCREPVYHRQGHTGEFDHECPAEEELLRAYDTVAKGGWQLIKYCNGEKFILRGTDADYKYGRIMK